MSPIVHALARTRTRTIARLFVLSLAIVAARPIAAQSTDSLPFRARQWGAEFSASSGFGSAGILRFLSPRRALLLDVGAAISHESPSTVVTTEHSNTASVRLGERFYHPIGRRVVQFATIGANAYESSIRLHTPTGANNYGEDSSNQWVAGIFAGVGAAWMVSPGLSLGATYEGSAGYSKSVIRMRKLSTTPVSIVRTERRRLDAHVGDVALRVTLFF